MLKDAESRMKFVDKSNFRFALNSIYYGNVYWVLRWKLIIVELIVPDDLDSEVAYKIENCISNRTFLVTALTAEFFEYLIKIGK